jgi:hypothetical protein
VAVVTVFREAGSKGRYIAEELARALGYHFSDYWIAERLLLMHGFSETPGVYQTVPDFWDRFTKKGPEREAIVSLLGTITVAQGPARRCGDVGAGLLRAAGGAVGCRQRAGEGAA